MEKLQKEKFVEKTKNENKEQIKEYLNEKDNNSFEKEEIKKIPKKFFRFKDILIIFLSILSFYFYFKSFKGCDGTQSYCLVTLSPSFFYLLGIYILISSVITLYIIYQILSQEVSFFHCSLRSHCSSRVNSLSKMPVPPTGAVCSDSRRFL